MFTAIYQQPNDINLNQEQFEIINPDIKISDFSLEKFRCADYEIEMVFSNHDGKKFKATFRYIQSILTPKALVKNKLGYYDPKLLGHMFKVNNSSLIEKLIEKTHDDLKLKALKNGAIHYVFPLKNVVLEAVVYTDGVEIVALN